MHLPESVTTRAKHLFADVSSDPHFKGTRRAGLVEGCLYAALQSQGGARTVEEMSAGVNNTGVKRMMKVMSSKDKGGACAPCTVRSFLERRTDKLAELFDDDETARKTIDRAVIAAEAVDTAGICSRY